MNRKEILMNYLTTKRIKGLKPAYVYLKANIGRIYNGAQSDFILSIRDGILYFQKLSIFHNLKPAYDFELDLKTCRDYKYSSKGQFAKSLCIYDRNNRFVEIYYNCGFPDTYYTEDNMARIIKEIEELGIKETKQNESID